MHSFLLIASISLPLYAVIAVSTYNFVVCKYLKWVQKLLRFTFAFFAFLVYVMVFLPMLCTYNIAAMEDLTFHEYTYEYFIVICKKNNGFGYCCVFLADMIYETNHCKKRGFTMSQCKRENHS